MEKNTNKTFIIIASVILGVVLTATIFMAYQTYYYNGCNFPIARNHMFWSGQGYNADNANANQFCPRQRGQFFQRWLDQNNGNSEAVFPNPDCPRYQYYLETQEENTATEESVE